MKLEQSTQSLQSSHASTGSCVRSLRLSRICPIISYLHSVHCLPGSELLQESARGPGRNLRPVVIAVSPSDCTPAHWSKWSTITAPILLSFRHSIPNLTLVAAKSQKEQLQSHGSKMQQAGIHSCWCHWHAGYMGQETCRRTWSHEPLVST